MLFFVGFLGLLLLNSQKVADYFKEQLTMMVTLKDGTKDVEIKQLQRKIQLDQTTKTVVFVSKEQAAASYAQEIGEDFIEFLGYNPLLNALEVTFNASYVNIAAIQSLQSELQTYDFVAEAIFDEPLVVLLDENIEKITWGLLAVAGLFIVIALLLINSSIRLAIYSKRFVIKTMQLVGATKGFICKPFIWSHFRIGLLSSFFAIAGLGFLFYELDQRFPKLGVLKNPYEIAGVMIGVLVFGTTITVMSTFLATRRYLKLKTDAIY